MSRQLSNSSSAPLRPLIVFGTRPEAIKDAIKVQSFDEDHVSILSNSQVIRMVEDFLGS